ncbi:YdbC family protein [Streptococcus cameli]
MKEKDDAFRYEKVKAIAVLSEDSNGWRKEVNWISFNGKPPMLDIRKWSPNGRMSKGIALKAEEAQALKEVLMKMDIKGEIYAS